MKRYKEKFIWQNLFYSNLTIIVVILLIILLGRAIFGIYKKFEITKTDYEYVAKEVDEAEKKMVLDELKLENINTKEGEEKYIRETYPLKKEKEDVIIVYDAPASAYEIPKDKAKIEIFKDFFMNLFKR